MYVALLILHSWTRWAVALTLLVRLVMSVRGWAGARAWSAWDRRASLAWVVAFDTQLLLGIGLYATSPLVRAAWRDIGIAMKDDALRFWAIEHWFAMLGAIVAVHVGHVRSKRNPDPAKKHRAAVIACIVAAVLISAAVPWPGRANVGRPLFLFP